MLYQHLFLRHLTFAEYPINKNRHYLHFILRPPSLQYPICNEINIDRGSEQFFIHRFSFSVVICPHFFQITVFYSSVEYNTHSFLVMAKKSFFSTELFSGL